LVLACPFQRQCGPEQIFPQESAVSTASRIEWTLASSERDNTRLKSKCRFPATAQAKRHLAGDDGQGLLELFGNVDPGFLRHNWGRRRSRIRINLNTRTRENEMCQSATRRAWWKHDTHSVHSLCADVGFVHGDGDVPNKHGRCSGTNQLRQVEYGQCIPLERGNSRG
jgi:hypothetical protein